MSRRLFGADNRKAMMYGSLPQGERGYELLRAALTEVEDSRPPAFRRLEQAVGGDPRLGLGLFALAVDADEEEDRAESDQSQHRRRALVEPDREDEEAPQVEAQEESPDERFDAWFNSWESQVHRGSLNGTKKIRRASFTFVHRFR